jgi:hypothetical protein
MIAQGTFPNAGAGDGVDQSPILTLACAGVDSDGFEWCAQAGVALVGDLRGD